MDSLRSIPLSTRYGLRILGGSVDGPTGDVVRGLTWQAKGGDDDAGILTYELPHREPAARLKELRQEDGGVLCIPVNGPPWRIVPLDPATYNARARGDQQPMLETQADVDALFDRAFSWS